MLNKRDWKKQVRRRLKRRGLRILCSWQMRPYQVDPSPRDRTPDTKSEVQVGIRNLELLTPLEKRRALKKENRGRVAFAYLLMCYAKMQGISYQQADDENDASWREHGYGLNFGVSGVRWWRAGTPAEVKTRASRLTTMERARWYRDVPIYFSPRLKSRDFNYAAQDRPDKYALVDGGVFSREEARKVVKTFTEPQVLCMTRGAKRYALKMKKSWKE